MADLAQKTAGQFTRIEHAPNDRAGESAQIIQQANPKAQVVPAEGLKPWALGEHEGQPVETEKAAINARITDTPEEAPPGGHDQSTAPGEPFDAAQARTVQHYQDQVAKLRGAPWLTPEETERTARSLDLPQTEIERAASLPYQELERLSQQYNGDYNDAVSSGKTLREITSDGLDSRAGLYANLAQRAHAAYC
jgi:hypothetical protein